MRKIKNELCNNRRLLSVVLAIIDVAFIALLLIGLCIGIFGKHTYNFSIEYGEEHSNKNYAQMYYAPSVKKMTEEDSINAYFENKKAKASKSFKIGTVRSLKNLVESKEWTELQMFLTNIKMKENTVAVGTGGNINTLFKKSQKQLGKPLSYKYLKDTWKELSQ